MCVVFYITLFPPKNNFYIIIFLVYFLFGQNACYGILPFLLILKLEKTYLA
jgi:hypothetical protein